MEGNDTADTDSSTVSPSDAVTDTEATPADPEAAGEGNISISDLLLSTEPEESPAEYQGTPSEIAHAIIGIKKMLRGAGANVRSGVPALQNFAMAGLGFVTGGSGEGSEAVEGEDTV